ncbi:MAG TPA: SRPBCC family protein [Mycobacteriales bacterium]|nr:SRPBCC family protein [Mycobacteriales bacterium]
MASERKVSRSRVIDAPPSTIFALLSDARKHPNFDGSGSVKATLSAPDRLEMGSKFGMRMHVMVPYVMSNEVVEYEPDALIAWQHFGHHRWRYELKPLDGGRRTEVTETFDWSTSRAPWFIELMGYPAKNAQSIEATLERLAEVAAT